MRLKCIVPPEMAVTRVDIDIAAIWSAAGALREPVVAWGSRRGFVWHGVGYSARLCGKSALSEAVDGE